MASGAEPIYVFDIDETLVFSNEPIKDGIEAALLRLMSRYSVILVTNGTKPNLDAKLSERVLESSSRVFTCSGSQEWCGRKLLIEEEHKFSNDILELSQEFINASKFSMRQSIPSTEVRCGLLNVPLITRESSNSERTAYFEWDQKVGERRRFASTVNDLGVPYEASIGGMISVDIVPLGGDKSRIIDRLQRTYSFTEIVFLGDQLEPGGNDYPLAERMRNDGLNHRIIEATDEKTVQKFLEIEATGL